MQDKNSSNAAKDQKFIEYPVLLRSISRAFLTAANSPITGNYDFLVKFACIHSLKLAAEKASSIDTDDAKLVDTWNQLKQDIDRFLDRLKCNPDLHVIVWSVGPYIKEAPWEELAEIYEAGTRRLADQDDEPLGPVFPSMHKDDESPF